MNESVLVRLESKLKELAIHYRLTTHEPVFTSEEAARIRGASLASGAKALIVKMDEEFSLLVIPADRKLDSKKVRQQTGAKSIRFATREEVEKLTTLLPGSIPPFGSLFGIPTRCDPSLGESEIINFNAGDHSVSCAMRFQDYLKAENPGFFSMS